MRHKWKRLLLTTMAVGMLSSVTAFAANVSMNLFYNGKNHAYNAKEIVVKIDGKTMTPKDMPAVAIDGRTLLPMRQIAQELGCEVTWNEEAKQAYVINDDYTLVFEMNKATGYKNGKTLPGCAADDCKRQNDAACACAGFCTGSEHSVGRCNQNGFYQNDGKHHADNTYNTDKSNHTHNPHHTHYTERELCHAE